MKAVQAAPPTLRYNSFLPNNRRREALDELEWYIESDKPIHELSKWLCKDDLAAIVEMMVEERRSMNRFVSPVENAELV